MSVSSDHWRYLIAALRTDWKSRVPSRARVTGGMFIRGGMATGCDAGCGMGGGLSRGFLRCHLNRGWFWQGEAARQGGNKALLSSLRALRYSLSQLCGQGDSFHARDASIVIMCAKGSGSGAADWYENGMFIFFFFGIMISASLLIAAMLHTWRLFMVLHHTKAGGAFPS